MDGFSAWCDVHHGRDGEDWPLLARLWAPAIDAV
jgi:hypothetical protein